jgi:hypothetical protein
MADLDLTPEEIEDMFGGEAEEITPDPEELEIAVFLKDVRTQLCALAEHEGVTHARLAKRMHITPPAVSRTLHGEGDMKMSTAALYARALGHRCEFVLVPDRACQNVGNHGSRQEVYNLITVQTGTERGVIGNTSTTTAGGFSYSIKFPSSAPHSTTKISASVDATVAADA